MARPKAWKLHVADIAKVLQHPRLAGVRCKVSERFKKYDFREEMKMIHETHEIVIHPSSDYRSDLDAVYVILQQAGYQASERSHVFYIYESRLMDVKTKKQKSKRHKFHELPGLTITTPHVQVFDVQDNNGNWLIERPLFRWVRVDKTQALEEAKMLNLGYQHCLYDLIAKRPEAMALFKKLKGEMKGVEKQLKGVSF